MAHQEDLKSIYNAALLHDIGKVKISNRILYKPGLLTDQEFEIIKAHPEYGAEILKKRSNYNDDIIQAVLHHHERWDGKGYPAGLKGEEIPLSSRIIAVADTFDAMTSDRPYRKAFPIGTALEEIKAKAGTQFDPYVAEVFIKKIMQQLHIIENDSSMSNAIINNKEKISTRP